MSRTRMIDVNRYDFKKGICPICNTEIINPVLCGKVETAEGARIPLSFCTYAHYKIFETDFKFQPANYCD